MAAAVRPSRPRREACNLLTLPSCPLGNRRWLFYRPETSPHAPAATIKTRRAKTPTPAAWLRGPFAAQESVTIALARGPPKSQDASIDTITLPDTAFFAYCMMKNKR